MDDDGDDDVIVLDDEEPTRSNASRPLRKAAAKAKKVTKSLAKKKKEVKPQSTVRNHPNETTTSQSLVLPNLASIGFGSSNLIQPQFEPQFVLAEPVGTTQRVLIPNAHFQKLLPGQFRYIGTVQAKVSISMHGTQKHTLN